MYKYLKIFRFEELVKFIGRQLSPDINFFILHLEEEDKKNQQAQTKKKPDGGSSRKQEILKNTRLIPKLVYAMEQFSKCIMQLSSKTKIDLHKYIGQGTTRDFRILVNELAITEENDGDSQENVDDDESEVIGEGNEDEAENNEGNDNAGADEQDSYGDSSDSSGDNEQENNSMHPAKKVKR